MPSYVPVSASRLRRKKNCTNMRQGSKVRMSAAEFQAYQQSSKVSADQTQHKEKAHRGHPESSLQIACVKWFRMQYPWPRYLIASAPNGGFRNPVEAEILKAEGVWSGMPDLYIPMSRKGYTALYIEMKAGKAGRVSQAQKETMDFLTANGAKCIVCRDIETFVDEVNSYLK